MSKEGDVSPSKLLRELMYHYGFTHERMAYLFNRKRGTIHRWVSGKSPIPPYVFTYFDLLAGKWRPGRK